MLVDSRFISVAILVAAPFALAGCVVSGDAPQASFRDDEVRPVGTAGADDADDALVLPVNEATRGPAPDSQVFDRCRQSFPGIVSLGQENETSYDHSALDSSQQFEISGSGEWDDNANYRRFLELVSKAPVHDAVDVSNRQFVVVLDEHGRGVGNCSLRLSDSTGTHATLTTLASGRVPVFPELYGLEGTTRVEARCGSRKGTTTLSLESLDQVAKIQLEGAVSTPVENTLDLAFVLDVTGSMAAEIEAMKKTIDAVATEIVRAGESQVRLALVAYRDYGDQPEFQFVDFTSDLSAFRAHVAALEATGGGDVPEAVNEAIHWATRLDWNAQATARMAFVIGDAPPHPGEDYSAAREAAVLACGGVKIFTVATTGQAPSGRFIFRQMSQLSYATHLFLLRDGVAPNAECANYEFRTGELHNLVIERVKGELTAQDDDPLDIPGLGEDRDTEVAEALEECAVAASVATGEDLSPVVK